MKEFRVKADEDSPYDGMTFWVNGEVHWIKNDDGLVRHFRGDKLHRIGAPAVIYPDGSQFFYQNDKLHNEAGPAALRADGTKEWWIHGEKMSQEEFDRRMKKEIIEVDGKKYKLIEDES